MVEGSFEFRAQERVVYGRPAGAVLAEIISGEQARRVFFVTSASVARSASFQAVTQAVSARTAGSFTQVRPNSLREDVLAGAAAARACGADLIVAVGGGSVLDAAKVMQICLWNDLASIQDLDAFRAPEGKQGKEGITDAACSPRIIALPTLLSGAEFTHFAGVTDGATGRKEAYEHPLMIPRIVILDPDLLADSPPALIATTGARALDHCIETFCSPRSMAYFDALALEGLGLLWRALPRIHGGSASRDDLMDALLGAWLAIAAPAAGVPVGASHALARVIGSLCGVSHGRGSAVMQPAVLRWNARDEAALDRQTMLMLRAGIEGESLADAVERFLRSIGQPTRLHEVEVPPARFETIADFGMEMLRHPSVTGNARPITDRGQILDILAEANHPSAG